MGFKRASSYVNPLYLHRVCVCVYFVAAGVQMSVTHSGLQMGYWMILAPSLYKFFTNEWGVKTLTFAWGRPPQHSAKQKTGAWTHPSEAQPVRPARYVQVHSNDI